MRLSWKIALLAVSLSGLPSLTLGRAVPLDKAPACVDDGCADVVLPRGFTPPKIQPIPKPPKIKPGSEPIPHVVIAPNPGAVGGAGAGDTKILSMTEYRANGDKARSALDNAISKNTPDSTVKPEGNLDGDGTYANIKDGYTSDSDIWKVDTKYPELPAVIGDDDIGFVSGAQYRERITRSNAPGTWPEAITNDCAFDHENGVIVAAWNFADNDKWPKGDPHRLPFSELTWQSMMDSAPKKFGKPTTFDPKSLKLIIRRDVVNPGTNAIVEDVYKASNIPLTQKATFSLDSIDPKIVDGFKTLSGSDNVKGVYYMLKDHHNAVGGKTIKKIIVYPKQMEGSNGKLTLALVLG